MLLQLHNMQQISAKSQEEVLELARRRRERQRQESIVFAARWGAIVATIVVLAFISPTRSTISVILYAAAVLAAVYATYISPDAFSLKPIGEVGASDIAPEHEPISDDMVVKLINAAQQDNRVDQVLRPWMESGQPIRMEQFEAVQRFVDVASKEINACRSRAALDQKREEYLSPLPHVARENSDLDTIALPIAAAAAAAALRSSGEDTNGLLLDDAATHSPDYVSVANTRDITAYHHGDVPLERNAHSE